MTDAHQVQELIKAAQDLKDTITLIKWVVAGAGTVLVGAITAMWFHIKNKSRCHALTLTQREAEKDKLHQEWREDKAKVQSEHKADMRRALKQNNDLAQQVSKTLDHILGKGGGS